MPCFRLLIILAVTLTCLVGCHEDQCEAPADLAWVTIPMLLPNPPVAGQEVVFACWVANHGGTTAPATHAVVFIDGRRAAIIAIPELPSGLKMEVFDVIGFDRPGIHEVVVEIDPMWQIYEENHSNNTISFFVQVLCGCAAG